MIYAQDFSTFYPLSFVSEIVRRQRTRYEMPLAVSHQNPQPSYEPFVQREPALALRWIPAFGEDGKRYLRMEYHRKKATVGRKMILFPGRGLKKGAPLPGPQGSV